MNKPQAVIQVHFGREWRIRRPYVYRYMERIFVDRFFDDGSLRLSSFKAFASHADNQRNDTSEGTGVVTHRTSESGGQFIAAAISQGHDAYVLCGSTRHHSELARSFSCDSGFRINDTTAFADAVAHRISGFRFGVEGNCLYLPHRTIDRNLGHINLDSLKAAPDDASIDIGKTMGFIGSMADGDLYFMKPSCYAHQNEYRLVWIVHGVAEPFLDIKCPEAREHCVRFEDLMVENEST